MFSMKRCDVFGNIWAIIFAQYFYHCASKCNTKGFSIFFFRSVHKSHLCLCYKITQILFMHSLLAESCSCVLILLQKAVHALPPSCKKIVQVTYFPVSELLSKTKRIDCSNNSYLLLFYMIL